MESFARGGTRGFGRARPAELIALVLALEERDGLEEQDRRRLDREIGSRHADREGLELLRVWLSDAPGLGLRARIERVESSLSLLRWLLLGVGIFLGWAATATLLQVEVHAGRINIVLCLALLVLLPLGMLGLGVVGALWSARNGVGLGDGVGDGAGAGGWRRFALARGAMRLLPASVRADVEILLGRLTAHSRLYAGVQRAQLFVWSQWIGLAFALGALLASLAFVVFTDLAFGWSTTLDVDATSVHRLVSWLSAPWASVWPEASPSLDLVETTRYFRVSQEEHIHFVDPIRYGGWWPFLVAALFFYGFLPRLIAAILAARGLSRELGTAIALTPGVDELLGRLTTPLLETRALEPEAAIGHAEPGLAPLVSAAEWMSGQGGEAPTLVRWAEASDDETLMARLDRPSLQVRDAGGRRSLESDAQLIEVLGAGSGGVAVCVRAFEPPVLDVLDFLADLRRAIGPERGLLVLLLAGRESDHEAWRHKLFGLGDPHLRMAVLAESASGGAR